MEDHRADRVEFWGALLVIALWVATTALMGQAWIRGLAPQWTLWIGFTVLACGALVPQAGRIFSRRGPRGARR